VDRNRNKIIDIIVSKKREKWVFVNMAQRLKRKGYKVSILCTDGYEGYSYYSLAERHVISKSETALVESKNSLIRLNLARFHRKTRRFSKAFDMIFVSLLILIHKSTALTILI
jgi:IS1 family transposase